MTGKQFKAKVTLEAIRSELTVSQLVAKHDGHQTLIDAWKKQAMVGMAGGRASSASVAPSTGRLAGAVSKADSWLRGARNRCRRTRSAQIGRSTGRCSPSSRVVRP